MLCLQLLDELYHTDKGYSLNHTVVLSDKPLGVDVKHVLHTHDAANKVVFLQGSPFHQPVSLIRCMLQLQPLSVQYSTIR